MRSNDTKSLLLLLLDQDASKMVLFLTLAPTPMTYVIHN